MASFVKWFIREYRGTKTRGNKGFISTKHEEHLTSWHKVYVRKILEPIVTECQEKINVIFWVSVLELLYVIRNDTKKIEEGS